MLHDLLRRSLGSHGFNSVHRRADKHQFIGCAKFAESGIFRQKAVTRMNGLTARGFGRIDDALHLQIGVGWR